jgi:uncharacterized caspase-like protein
MRDILRSLVFFAILLLMAAPPAARAQQQPDEKRIALVVGNADYQAGKLQTSANDAGLIAQTLQAAGFDVVGARDLDQESLRRAFKDFLEKASSSGPNTVAFIYLSGYGLQLEGENYFVPIDATIARDLDVPTQAVRLSDYTRPLNSLNLKATILVLDAARQHPFAKAGTPLAGGLALVDPPPNALVAFSAAPGTVAPDPKQGSYGPYAQALTEMLREGGLKLDELFERVRLRVNASTKGAEVPWNASNIEVPVVIFERGADAPPETTADAKAPSIDNEPIADLGPKEAYNAAVNRDTIDAYQEFITAFPEDPLAKRARALIAARREAVTWGRTRTSNTPAAYWSYLKRYPKGPHASDCRRRLAYLSAELEPPPVFDQIDYDVPPPPPEELAYIDGPAIVFDDPEYDFAPPPPPPVYWLPPVPVYIVELPPPPPPIAVFVLPVPVFVPIPTYVYAPVYVAPPPRNIYFENIHNEVVFNNVTNKVVIKDRGGRTRTFDYGRDDLRHNDKALALAPTLPPSVERKAKSFDGGRKDLSDLDESSAQKGGQRDRAKWKNRLPGEGLPGTNDKTGKRTNSETATIGPDDASGRRGKRERLDKRSGEALRDGSQSPDETTSDRQRLNRMRSEARRQKLKAHSLEARGENGQDLMSDEAPSGGQPRTERRKRMRDFGAEQFQDRRRRSYDRSPQSLADEQGPSQGMDQFGGGGRAWRKQQQQRDFRRSDEFGGQQGGQQEDRRNRKRSRNNGPCGESDQQGCGSGQ